jgi:hypothetical protein
MVEMNQADDDDIGEDDDGDFERTFSVDLMVFGFDALWCADFRLPCLVRVDPARFKGSVFLEIPAVPEPTSDRWQGPAALDVGLGGVWILDRVGSLCRIDPGDGSLAMFVPPFPFNEMALGAGAIFGIGEWGDGRLGRVSPDGAIEVATVGESLRLVAAQDDLVWTVDDAAATVLAIDARSLEVVRRFSHLGSPDHLWAEGRKSWYLSGHEVLHGDERAMVIDSSRGAPHDLLAMDADEGRLETLTTVYAPAACFSSPEGFWMTSEHLTESIDEDALLKMDLVRRNGKVETRFDVIGQADGIASDGAALWVSGFRVSRQRTVVTKIDFTGQTLGEVDFDDVDVTRWIPEPEPYEWPALEEWATAVCQAVEVCLTEPGVSTNRYGAKSLAPPIAEEFHLGSVNLRVEKGVPFIDVVFTWDGVDSVLGRSYRLEQHDEIAGISDAYISTYLQEELLAGGLGVENAVRLHRDGIDWLTWPRWDNEDSESP